jgi:hypothetical protein
MAGHAAFIECARPNGLVRYARSRPTITPQIISPDMSGRQNPVRLVDERRVAAGLLN